MYPATPWLSLVGTAEIPRNRGNASEIEQNLTQMDLKSTFISIFASIFYLLPNIGRKSSCETPQVLKARISFAFEMYVPYHDQDPGSLNIQDRRRLRVNPLLDHQIHWVYS